MSARALPPELFALTPGDLTAGSTKTFVASVEVALGAGLTGILVREPDLGDRALLDLARAIAQRLPANGYLAIHDRAHLVAACGARALHLGFRSLAPTAARALVSDDVALGFSGHAHDDPRAWDGTDYAFFGPLLDTPSKAGIVAATGFDALAQACLASPVPVWAIGGLRAEHVPLALSAGACGVAVRGGIFGAQRDDAPTLEARVRAYLRAFTTNGARASRGVE